MSENQQSQIQQTMRAHRTKHFLHLPHDDPSFPRSEIVRGNEYEYDYKEMVTEIYDKYIRIGSQLEINMEYGTRRGLSALIACNQWQSNEHFDHPRSLLFELASFSTIASCSSIRFWCLRSVVFENRVVSVWFVFIPCPYLTEFWRTNFCDVPTQ